MTRVYSRAIAAPKERNVGRTRARKKKPYKIVFESVTQEKKRLLSSISYDPQAPPGYTFVPVGIPDLTQQCIEFCTSKGLHAHIVSAAPKNKAQDDPEKISHHIHRIGYHFPSAVVDQACEWLGYNSRNGRLYRQLPKDLEDSRLARRLAVHSRHETNDQIKAAVRDLFPRIPDADVEAIVKHAFRQGTGRVGSVAELSLARRVQLAVLAHIRHQHTDYDKLLKTGTWIEARAKVEQACLEQLRKWRGEHDDDTVELEDAFREIIVIDDDDDSDDSSSSGDTADERAPSVEIISSQTAAHHLRTDDPFGPERLVVDERGRLLKGAYIALPRPRSAVAVDSNSQAYPSYSDHLGRLAVRQHAPSGYLPPPAELQSGARLPVRSAEMVHRLSSPAGRHGQQQRENYVANYPETYVRQGLTNGREEPPARTYAPTARMYAEGSSSRAFIQTTREAVAQSAAAADYVQPLKTGQESPVRFAQPSHRYTYSEVDVQKALLIARANTYSSREPHPGHIRVNASQAHGMDLVLPSIEDGDGAHANPSNSSPVFLGERLQHERRPIYVEYPADATSAPIGQDFRIERDGQPQRQITRPRLVPKRKSWPTQQSHVDHERADELVTKRLRYCDNNEQRRPGHNVPTSQRSSDALGTKQRVYHDDAMPTTSAAVIDLTESPYKPQSSYRDMSAYAEPFDRYRSSMTVQNSETRHQVYTHGEPTTRQTDRHYIPSGRSTGQSSLEYFGQAPSLPHSGPKPHETAALGDHHSAAVPLIPSQGTVRSNIYSNGPSVQSLARQVVVREHKQQRSVPKYTLQTRDAVGLPTEQQPQSQRPLSRGLPLSQSQVYRKVPSNQSYGNEPLNGMEVYRATNVRLPHEH